MFMNQDLAFASLINSGSIFIIVNDTNNTWEYYTQNHQLVYILYNIKQKIMLNIVEKIFKNKNIGWFCTKYELKILIGKVFVPFLTKVVPTNFFVSLQQCLK